MKYTAPSPEELQRLKDETKLKSHEMAELFGLSSGRHWRSYTESNRPRTISAQTLFFGIARRELDPATLELVLTAMRAVGATIDLDTPTDSPEPDGEPQP